MFTFLKNDCPNSSLAPDVERKLFEWRSFEKKIVQSWVVVVVVCRKNSN